MTGIVRDPGFYKKSAAIAVPIALQSMITMGVNMMDTIMVGRLGEQALSAVSLANQFITLFQICCMGMGMGREVQKAWFPERSPSGLFDPTGFSVQDNVTANAPYH